VSQWLGMVLVPVAHLCHHEGGPPLAALVVDPHTRWVGEAYDVLRVDDRLPITDPHKREVHASAARLECYRWAGSAPADAEPAPVPEPVGRRRARPAASASSAKPRVVVPPAKPRIAASDRPVTVCDRCFMALPATGVCDNCD
jgi:hypothetical protein